MKKLILFLFSIYLVSCKKIDNTNTTTAEYVVQNKTSTTLVVKAENMNSPVILKNSLIPENTSALIYEVEAGTGAHVFPSNFLSDIKVYARVKAGDSLIYSGVRNEDWQELPSGNGQTNLTLTIY